MTHQRPTRSAMALLAVLSVCAVSNVEARSYLLSNDKGNRCESLNAWVDSIIAAADADALAGDSATVADAAASAFARKSMVRYIGRAYDGLSSKHLKQISKDLDRCQFSDQRLASSLKVAFDPKRSQKSESGLVWLRAIYQAYNESTRTGLQQRFSSGTDALPSHCQAGPATERLGGGYLRAADLEAANVHLKGLTRAANFAANTSLQRTVQRYRDDLEFQLQSVRAQPRRFQAPEVYESVLIEEIESLDAMLTPEAARSLLSDYASAHASAMARAVERIEAAPDTFATWPVLIRFELALTSEYRRRCIESQPALTTFAMDDNARQQLDAAFRSVTTATEAKLRRVLAADEQAFMDEIQTLRSDVAFREFSGRIVPTTNLVGRITADTPMFAAYLARRERFDEYKQEIKALIERTELEISARARLALRQHPDWSWPADSAAAQQSRALLEAINDAYPVPLLDDLLSQDGLARQGILLFRDSEDGARNVQTQLGCSARNPQRKVYVRLVADWELANANDPWLDVMRLTADNPDGRELQLQIQRAGQTYMTNVVAVAAPGPKTGYLQYALMSPDRRRWVLGSKIEYEGLVDLMWDACYPADKRKSTLELPVFE